MDIRYFAGASALMLAIAACGSGDGAIMGEGANALTPEQVDAALGPEIANEAGVPANTADAQAVEERDAVEATDEAEPVAAPPPERPARPEPGEEAEESAPETGTPADNNSSE